MLLSVDTKPAINRYPLLDLVTRIPACWTCAGSKGRGQLQLVLHLHLRDVGIGPRREGQRGGRRAGVVAIGRQIQQVIEPAHLLLDHLHDGIFRRSRRRRPGSFAVIWIEGGAIVGYCSIGIATIDNPPTSMIMIAIHDREDRSVDEKTWPSQGFLFDSRDGGARGRLRAVRSRNGFRRDRGGRRGSGARRLRLDRLHHGTRLHLLHAGHDDAIAVLEGRVRRSTGCRSCPSVAAYAP